jgi:hypothetical protein
MLRYPCLFVPEDPTVCFVWGDLSDFAANSAIAKQIRKADSLLARESANTRGRIRQNAALGGLLRSKIAWNAALNRLGWKRSLKLEWAAAQLIYCCFGDERLFR